METRTYLLKLQTDNKEADNFGTLEFILNRETERGNIIAYSFKEIMMPKLDEDK